MLQSNRLTIYAIGKVKKLWIRDGINQYKKRMPELIINELKTFNLNNLRSNNNIIICLSEEGKQLNSVELCSLLLNFNNKKINLIDQSYNSNPLSLKSAIKNFDKVNSKKSNKYLLIGDMLELGSHSKKLHESIAPIINQTKIDKVFVKGKMASIIFASISKAKKGKILLNNSQIIELIRKDLNNNDYLMIKASLATGFNDIVKDLKGLL